MSNRRFTRFANRPDSEAESFALLEAADDLEQVPRLRIAVRTEHAHQALGRLAGQFAEFPKADGGIDVIAQNRLARPGIPCKQAFDAFLEQRFPERGIALDPRPNRLLEISCQRHAFKSQSPHARPNHDLSQPSVPLILSFPRF